MKTLYIKTVSWIWGTLILGTPHRQIYIDLGSPSPNLHRFGDPIPISMIDMGTPHPNIHGRYGDPNLYTIFWGCAMALGVLNSVNCIIGRWLAQQWYLQCSRDASRVLGLFPMGEFVVFLECFGVLSTFDVVVDLLISEFPLAFSFHCFNWYFNDYNWLTLSLYTA